MSQNSEKFLLSPHRRKQLSLLKSSPARKKSPSPSFVFWEELSPVLVGFSSAQREILRGALSAFLVEEPHSTPYYAETFVVWSYLLKEKENLSAYRLQLLVELLDSATVTVLHFEEHLAEWIPPWQAFRQQQAKTPSVFSHLHKYQTPLLWQTYLLPLLSTLPEEQRPTELWLALKKQANNPYLETFLLLEKAFALYSESFQVKIWASPEESSKTREKEKSNSPFFATSDFSLPELSPRHLTGELQEMMANIVRRCIIEDARKYQQLVEYLQIRYRLSWEQIFLVWQSRNSPRPTISILEQLLHSFFPPNPAATYFSSSEEDWDQIEEYWFQRLEQDQISHYYFNTLQALPRRESSREQAWIPDPFYYLARYQASSLLEFWFRRGGLSAPFCHKYNFQPLLYAALLADFEYFTLVYERFHYNGNDLLPFLDQLLWKIVRQSSISWLMYLHRKVGLTPQEFSQGGKLLTWILNSQDFYLLRYLWLEEVLPPEDFLGQRQELLSLLLSGEQIKFLREVQEQWSLTLTDFKTLSPDPLKEAVIQGRSRTLDFLVNEVGWLRSTA